MELAYITNDATLARLAEEAGVDRIFIDLESLGKAERQSGRDLFLSSHRLSDIETIRKAISSAKLMVRVDPIHLGSAQQIASVIDAGADLIMLPYFHQPEQALEFLQLVEGRAESVLLVETQTAAASLDSLLHLPGLSEIHLGLNDLSLSLGKKFLFDLIADGTVAGLCNDLRKSGLPYGFGGIASLHRNDLAVPPELMLAYQVCLGATRGWLGRTFRDIEPLMLAQSIQALRRAIAFWQASDAATQQQMRRELWHQIAVARG
jgi:hypothetical protein